MWYPSSRTDKKTSQDLSASPLAYTTSFGRRTRLDYITLRASVAISETITLTLKSVDGSNYDTVLNKSTLDSEQDYVYRPDGGLDLQAGDEIEIQCTNANGTGIVYVKIKAKELLI